MTTGIEVNLSLTEFLSAVITGATRHFESVSRGKKDSYGKREDQSGVGLHIEGACGEIAAAKALKVYFPASVNTYKGADLGDITQVKTRSRHDYDLLVRPVDKEDHLFVLVTGSAPNFWVRGWISGADAKKPEYTQGYGGRVPAYFVPVEDLHPIETFFN